MSNLPRRFNWWYVCYGIIAIGAILALTALFGVVR
jgi:hypothetical protein